MKNHHCPCNSSFFFLESIFPGIMTIHWAGYFNGQSSPGPLRILIKQWLKTRSSS